MTRLRCGPLAAWAAAWLAGLAAFDDVLTAASVGAAAPSLALVAPGSPNAGRRPVDEGLVTPLGEILISWRRANAQVRLVLPVPGDLRGVPGPPIFRTAALDAGQAVVGSGPTEGLAVVPEVIDRRPSSAPPSLSWRSFDTELPIADYISVADAQYELTEAIRECASTLAQLGERAVGHGDDLNGDLIAARRAGERINLPPGFAPAAVSLVAQAERMAAVLTLAGVDRPTDAGPDDRSDLLAPLVTAVRRARLAGYNAATSAPG